ncbi:shikimate dehydrogenase [Mumia sp. DW29H23]|uniref:shikimate dehydrogenase n=1 Tax=Mumia sp. DW29H23 TaxID=3421241 RepID=UPI003D6887D5
MPRCAVLGSPIAHSLSPVMHRAAYAELGLVDWTYDVFDVDEDGIGPFLSGLDESWRGLSLTMPLKRAVIPYLDTVSETAREVGGVNTVIVDVEGRHGFNTDVPGGVAALRERGVVEVEDAVVIGAGATAESMVASLRRLGLRRVTLAVRSLDRGALLAERIVAAAGGADAMAVEVTGIGPDLARSAQVVVSTVPADAIAPYAQMLVTRCDAVFDVIYEPWPTPLARAAHDAAVPVVSGLDLLTHQAVEQVRLMTGQDVSPALLHDAALGALASH